MNKAQLTQTGDEIRNFFNNTLKEVMSVLNAQCGSLFLFDCNNKELVLDSLYSRDSKQLRGLRQGIGQGVAGKVADIKKPVLVKDINLDGRFRRNGFNHYLTNSFISLPLISGNKLMGVISVADKSDGQPFDEKDLNFAEFICRYACMAADNFALKEEKEALDKQKNLLEKYASVGKLAAGIVHEINNPLDGVIRYINILLEQIERNSVAQEYLLEAKKGLNRIANITRSLLEFSHQVNLNPAQSKKYINAHEVIDEALAVLADSHNGNIRISKKYSGSAPRILDLGLSFVAFNMMKNAFDAMSEGGALEINTEIKEQGLTIGFKDTGAGIPADILEHIFEPFFTTKGMGKGTGLGLAICNEIIHKYEGNIEFKSVPAQGSTFIVTIPKKYLENA